MQSKHTRARELAAVAIDFELTADEQAELDDHLVTCVECRRYVHGLRYDTTALERLPRLDAPERVGSAVHLGRRPPRAAPWTLLAAAIGSIVVAVGVAVGSGWMPLGASSGAAASPEPSAAASAESSAAASPAPAGSSAPSSSASAAPSAGTLLDIRPGSVADVLVQSLRVRTKPHTDEALSARLEPFLSYPRQIAILDGPVAADGYEWYLVAPLDLGIEFKPVDKTPGNPLESQQWGWVAAASREGHPWIWPAEKSCPATPTTLAEVSTLGGLTGFVCFGGREITFPAVLQSDPCPDTLSSITDPAWFVQRAGVLFPPGGAQLPECGLAAHVDPAVVSDRDLQDLIGSEVNVTGMFDHPAARDCSFRPPDGDPVPAPDGAIPCRMAFAITAIQAR